MTTNRFGDTVCEKCDKVLKSGRDGVRIPRPAEGYTETICHDCTRDISDTYLMGCPE